MLTPPARPTAGPPRIADYRLLARIGEGGMGVVHLAQAPDGSRVALKVLRQHVIGDHEARERLAREVASLRLVHSPRVAEVLDADPWGDTPFVATRYVPGLSLHEHVREEGRVTGPDLAHLATGLIEAVIAVHAVGVLHRDIKPSNVLLEGRSPVLIDFGLARLAEDPRLTQTGWLLGTPGYLAPEILYGDDATPASDVHSWAATLAFAASGRPPFGTGPAMAIMDRVRRGEHDLTEVPPALLPLLRDCLTPEPADRPDTFAVLDELRRTAPPPRRRPGPAVPVVPPPPVPETAPVALLDPEPATLVTPNPAAPATRAAPDPGGDPEPPTRSSPATALGPLPVTRLSPLPATAAAPPRPSGLPRLQRGALLAGLTAAVAVGFASAPYLALLVLTVLALLLRGFSRTSESARDRQLRRGRGRWYDGPLTALSAPWHLLVAAGGTLVLVVCAAVVAVAVGCALLLFAAPLVPGLLLAGASVAASVWWGPGSRRVRAPTRSLLRAATGTPGTGWAALAVLAVVVALCGYALASAGVDWQPAPGAPWRAGTSLGELLRWL